ncbi:helix-turn-helix domain-containing protein [bacterium]|nr:helix-turn-helix domain-containing protein [bacterium]
MSYQDFIPHNIAAKKIPVAQSTLYRLVREGKIKAVKPGGKLMYRQEWLTAYALGFGTRLTKSQKAEIALLDGQRSEGE